MIYVNSPIQIIDTDNQSKNIFMQYGLYSYNWFLKYLIVSYDQITFNNFNSSKTVIQIVSNPRPVISIVNGTNSNSTSIVSVNDTDPVYLRYTGSVVSSQRSYIHDLTENSRSPISNFPLNHEYTISVDQMKNWLISGVDNYFKFSPNIQLVDSWTNYNIICNVDEYYFMGFYNFF